jgi:hypothetical protein
MTHGAVWLLVVSTCCAVGKLSAQDTILWNSDAAATNKDSAGQSMAGGFRFELGVFTGTFVPTNSNKADWAANWNVAQRTSYNTSTKRFTDSFVVTHNTSPFTQGKAAYVWGFKGDPLAGEWILFRAASWTWPSAAAFPPAFHEWFAKDATAVIGQIHSDGTPFLMKSAAVVNAAPPTTTYAQWKADTLTGEPLNAKGDDPDQDGSSNLLEYVFGTPPTVAGAPVATPVSVVGGFLQIRIPRRTDHPATLTVEVSDDLENWFSGPAHTEVVDNGLEALVVRDLTPFGGAHPKRFMRLRASL